MNPELNANIPADILESAEAVSLNLLPPKSRQIYEFAYQLLLLGLKVALLILGLKVLLSNEHIFVRYYN